MKAVHYTHAAGSGAARYIASLTGALKTQGVEVEILCPRDFVYASALSDMGIHVRTMPASLAMATGRVGKVARSIAQAVVGAVLAGSGRDASGVVHMNHIGIPLFALPLIGYLRLRRRRVLLTVHDVFPHHPLLPARLWPLERFVLRLLYRSADHLVVHYPAATRELRSGFSIPTSRVTVIPHGAEIRPRGLASRPATDATVHLALLGSLRANKGIHLAIGAVQVLRGRGLPVELTIAGLPEGSEADYWRSCIAAIDEAPDGLHVEATFLSDARMREILLDSDAVILPYVGFEAQSGVAIDALSTGRALIATGAGGLEELLATSGGGIRIESASQEAVCRAVETAIGLGRAGLAALGDAGASYARRELDWLRVADRHIALYDQLTRIH